MGYPHIALIGRARSGKDSVAAALIRRHQYTRVAFADPLREVVLAADPIVAYEGSGYGPLPVRLSAVVRRYGWEKAKDDFAEVRRALQGVGQAVRDQEAGFWLGLALDKVTVADTWRLPVVVTDCRYPNEADALKSRGFTLVRVLRPGYSDAPATHESETALDQIPTDLTVSNTGSLADLGAAADWLATRR
ncbi:hypothetical protein [Streptomyces sp. NPDC101206]|uniref:deoxynucleotide monophosphate kinase family protein n=1 Tax=Streptomyces sp. NPDC101206 TaxID=3366128 RepID=UPI0038084719